MKCGRAVMLTVSAADRGEGERIGRMFVDRRLAACVQLLPMTSIYRWQGAIEQADEVLLLVKTTDSRAGEAMAAIKQGHSYEVPEILKFRSKDGWPPYLAWLAAETA